MTKEEFINRVKIRAGIGSIFTAERATRAVLMTLKEAVQSEEIEEKVTEKLSSQLRVMFENPQVEAVKIPEFKRFTEDDVVEEGHEPEEIVVPVLEELKEVKL